MWSFTYGKTVSGERMTVRWQGPGWWGIHSHESAATRSVQHPALFATCNYSSFIAHCLEYHSKTFPFTEAINSTPLPMIFCSCKCISLCWSLCCPAWASPIPSSISVPFQSFPLLSKEDQLSLLFVTHPFVGALEPTALCFCFHHMLLLSFVLLQLFPPLCILPSACKHAPLFPG